MKELVYKLFRFCKNINGFRYSHRNEGKSEKSNN